jgi:UDP-N-acetylglucosamine acyltransferase
MPSIHSSAILTGEVRVGDDVIVGPYCVIDGSLGPVTLGAGCRLIAGVHLNGPLTLGERNILYPGAALGFAPQDLKWDPNVAGAGLIVGDGNTCREGVTIHRATSHEKPTRIGNDNYWMADSHAGHDCTVGNNNILANGTMLGGHVTFDDRIITGGGAGVHQFCRVGRNCMLSGNSGMTLDLPPYFMLTGINVAGSINVIGMRRGGMRREDIDTVKWVYKTLVKSRLPPKQALEVLRERAADPLVREYVEFIESSKRGICLARGRAHVEAAD